jgi:putative ABC transport system ATP-binding protein
MRKMPDTLPDDRVRALVARGLAVVYPGADSPAITGVGLTVEPGEIVAFTGPSGCGKSSLLYCLGGVIRPASGSVRLGGIDLASLTDADLSAIRAESLGFVFQFGELVPELTLGENVGLPLMIAGWRRKRVKPEVDRVMAALGIAELADKHPGRVSGGQAQRAAVARAMVHHPAFVLADEPTGALDRKNGEIVLDAMLRLAVPPTTLGGEPPASGQIVAASAPDPHTLTDVTIGLAQVAPYIQPTLGGVNFPEAHSHAVDGALLEFGLLMGGLLSVLTFLVATADRVVERRRNVTALTVLGCRRGVLRRAQAVQLLIPVACGASLALVAGVVAGRSYDIFGGTGAPWNWGETGSILAACVAATILACTAALPLAGRRVDPALIRRD